jgi:hypothetical protein
MTAEKLDIARRDGFFLATAGAGSAAVQQPGGCPGDELALDFSNVSLVGFSMGTGEVARYSCSRTDVELAGGPLGVPWTHAERVNQ